MNIYTFEEWLSDEKCNTHTNNSPEGFEKWLEMLDTQEVIDYAQEYAKYVQYETISDIQDKLATQTIKLHDELKNFKAE